MNDKIRAVIIDDEETAIDNLCFELKKYPWISVEGIAYNGKAGIRLLEKERPDLLFLDVELPDMLGMDLAIKVHEQQNWDMHIVLVLIYISTLENHRKGWSREIPEPVFSIYLTILFPLLSKQKPKTYLYRLLLLPCC